MLTFYLVRHGYTEANEKSIIMGSQIDTPLTEAGLKNIDIICEQLKNIKFDYAYTSDLGRAFITSHYIAKNLQGDLDIYSHKDLREINYGIYTYRKRDDIKKECPQYRTDPDFMFPEGESFSHMQARAINFIKKLEEAHKDKTLLLVAHSGIIRAIICHFNKWNPKDFLKMQISHKYIGKFVIENCELISCEKLGE